MTEFKFTDSEQITLTANVRLSIESSARDLEAVTCKANRDFSNLSPPLRLDQLPEYQTALDAIRAYSEASVSEFTRRYQEEKSKSLSP